MLLLDTHVLVWIMTDDRALGPSARAAVASAFADAELATSALSFWEIASLHARGRITIRDEPFAWRQSVLQLGIAELPIDGQIAVAAALLEGMHSDPADRLIVATAARYEASLLTAHRQILRWSSSLRRIDARR